MYQIKQKINFILFLILSVITISCTEVNYKDEIIKDEIVSNEVVEADASSKIINSKDGTTYVLASTQILNKNQFIETPSHMGVKLKLIMQGDSNLVLYSISSGNYVPNITTSPIAVWSSGTYFPNESLTNPRLIVQNDGNAVIYRNSPFGTPVWNSNSFYNQNFQNPRIQISIRRITYVLKPAKYFAITEVLVGNDQKIAEICYTDISNLFP